MFTLQYRDLWAKDWPTVAKSYETEAERDAQVKSLKWWLWNDFCNGIGNGDESVLQIVLGES
jgi:hypothetical protein